MGTSAKVAGILGVAVVAAGGCGGAYAFSDTVKSQVKLAFSSPQDYMEWVCEKNIADAADCSAASWQTALDMKQEVPGAGLSFSYMPSSDVKQLLVNELDNPDLEVVNAINSINSLGVVMAAKATDDDFTEHLGILYNDETLVSLDFAAQMAAGNLYARIPELTTRWVTVHLPDVSEKFTTYEQKQEDYIEAVSELYAHPEKYISAEDISTAVRRHGEILTSQFIDITEEKHANVAIADITADYTALTATIDKAGLEAIGNALMTYYRDECFLRGVLVDEMKVMSADEYVQIFTDSVDDMLGDFTGRVTVTFYTDPSGTIRAMNVETGDVKFFGGVGEQDEKVGAAWRVDRTGDYGFDAGVNVNAVRSGSAFTGTAVFTEKSTYSDETYAVNFENLELVNKTRGFVSGKISMDFPEEEVSFTADLSSDGKGQTMDAALKLGDKDFGRVKITVDETTGMAALESPDAANAFNIVDADGDFTLKGYLTEEDLDNFVETLLRKLGADDETASATAEQAWEMFEMLIDYYTMY